MSTRRQLVLALQLPSMTSAGHVGAAGGSMPLSFPAVLAARGRANAALMVLRASSGAQELQTNSPFEDDVAGSDGSHAPAMDGTDPTSSTPQGLMGLTGQHVVSSDEGPELDSGCACSIRIGKGMLALVLLHQAGVPLLTPPVCYCSEALHAASTPLICCKRYSRDCRLLDCHCLQSSSVL